MGIHLSKVTYDYTKEKVNDGIDDITFDIKEGDFLCICGGTGSGKSTLVSHLNALLLPQEGFLFVDDYKLAKKNKRGFDYNLIRQKVGFSFQFPEYQLFAETVLKDVMFGPLNFKQSKEDAKKNSLEVMNLLGISKLESQSPFELSGGQMRKVAIAGVLSSNPKYIILDEPTRGLDPKAAKEIMTIFVDLNKNYGKTIIVITHDMDLVANYSSRVIVLNKMKLVFDGTKEELFIKDDLQKLELDLPSVLKLKIFLESKLGVKVKDCYNKEQLISKLNEVRDE